MTPQTALATFSILVNMGVFAFIINAETKFKKL